MDLELKSCLYIVCMRVAFAMYISGLMVQLFVSVKEVNALFLGMFLDFYRLCVMVYSPVMTSVTLDNGTSVRPYPYIYIFS